jgi:hypothetical protein
MEINYNFQKILSGAIVIILLLVIFVDIRQQTAINELKKSLLVASQASQSQTSKKTQETLAETIITNAKKSKSFTGDVKEVAGDYFMIEATIVDISKIQAKKDYSNEAPPMIQKSFKITLSPETKFLEKKKTDIKVGDKVVVYSDKSPFENDELKAIMISLVK